MRQDTHETHDSHFDQDVPAHSIYLADSEELRSLVDYWDWARAGRKMPCKADIDPAPIADLLPFVALIEVDRLPLRFAFAYAGCGIAAAYGRELTGQYLDAQSFGDVGKTDASILARVAPSGQPAAGHDAYRRAEITMTRDWVALPLGSARAANPATAVMILMGQKWQAAHRLVS